MPAVMAFSVALYRPGRCYVCSGIFPPPKTRPTVACAGKPFVSGSLGIV